MSLIQDGVIALDKPTAETSVDELNEIVVEEYRRARAADAAAAAEQGDAAGAGATARAQSRTDARGGTRRPSAGPYAIGVDFGTESGRALLLDLSSGEELAVGVVPYPHGVIDRELPGSGERLGARLGAAGSR